MELWIRSQDKRQLLKVNDGLYIANGFTDTDDTFIGIKNVGHVGRYAEEERALEVLNEIQTKLDGSGKLPSNITDVSKQVFIPPFMVYEMPKE